MSKIIYMKTVAILSSFLFFASIGLSGPLHFENHIFHGTMEEALEKAKGESKKLLVKFGANWCLPCHWMDQTIFMGKEADSLFSKDWVIKSVDYDSPEGVALRSNFQIKVLPTLLIIDPLGGKIITKKEESMNLMEFKTWFSPFQNSVQIPDPIVDNLDIPTNTKQHNEISISVEQKLETSNAQQLPITLASPNLPPTESTEISAPNEEELFFKKQNSSKVNPMSAENNLSEDELSSLQDQTSTKQLIIVGDYYLRTGKYDDLEKAMNEIERLDKLFQQQASMTDEFDQNGEMYFTITIGSFVTEEEAGLFQQHLSKHNIHSTIGKLNIE
ncbi:MAG: thioredoxin family protein [Saprospiraceae bacterium]|nr:thioredoxin family protein [Saprospiraceae bacterium]